MSEGLVPGGLPTAGKDQLTAGDLVSFYTDALAANPGDVGEGALQRAYEIGRRGIAHGIGLLEIAALHHQALAKVVTDVSRSPRIQQQIRRAGQFLAECLSPYEMAQRGFNEAICALRRLNETMEGEIQRIAHAVHDEAGQLLDAARLAMSAVDRDANPVLRQRLHEIAGMLDQAEMELRRLSHELRPMILDDLGLVPALQVVAEGMARRNGLSMQVETCLEGRPPPNVETALYRIVQEALTNVIRHAHARNVKITLVRDAKGTLRCAIRDDGVGFDVVTVLSRKQRGGLGLIGIRERLNAVGGTLQIHSELHWGTELRIEIPAGK
jgi:signal transduction histidine kinase